MATKKSTKTTSTKSKAKRTVTNAKSTAKSAANDVADQAKKVQDEVQDQADEFVTKARKQIEETVESTNERVDAMLADAVKYSKEVSFATIGMPLALQSKITNGKLADIDSYKSLLDDAKSAGEKQFAQFEKLVEPYVKQITGIVDPAVDKVESMLPTQVQDVLADNRKRFDKIVNPS